MNPHKQMGRVLAKARAELDDINRRGDGQFDPRNEYRTLYDAVNDFHDLPSREPDPEPVWPMLLAVAAGVLLAFAIGYGVQSFWLGGM